MSRLKKYYEEVVRPDLLIKGNFKSIMQVPELKKIVLHMNIKDNIIDKKAILTGLVTMERMSGQRPTIVRAKKSVAAFHLKEGAILGCKVSLSGERMYNFLDKLVYVVLPRVKDFKPLKNNSFHNRGQYSLGLSDVLIFPEIESEYGKIPRIYGIDINISTSAINKEYAKLLLSSFQLPFNSTDE